MAMTPYDQAVLRVLAARGIVLGADGQWERAANYTGPNPPTEAQIRFMNESAGQPETNSRLVCQWVENLAQIVETLDRDGEQAAWPYMAVFWLRLHGLLTEVRANYTQTFQTMEIDPATYVPNKGSVLEYVIAAWRRIEPVREAFTDDELIYADYRRHTEGHPTQRSYDVRMNRAGQINDRHGVPSLGREFTVAELDAAILRVLAAHTNEHAVAVAFARRIRDLMPPLVAVMRRGIGRG
jgi:hypothetical protein